MIEFRVLGPLEVLYDGRPVTIPAAKQRALLTVLLLRAGTTVPGPRLIEELWGEDAPISARKVVQTYISKLRRVLPPGVLVTRPTGYVLRADPGCVDAASFERLLAEAAPADPEDEADLLRCALALWRGGALEDFADEPFAQADISRLEGLRLEALERRIELDVAAGRHAAVVGELAALVREHPFHEPLRGQLMLALYRAGRQDEALRAYQEGRRLLVDQLGVQPSLPLRRRQQAILRGEDWVDPPGAPGLQRRPGSATAAVPRTREAGRGGDAPGRTRSRLVGRARELAELQDLLLRHRLVTLIGPAGIGKTRLALEASARMRDAFPDGRFVVDLTTLQDPRLVAPAACSALGLRPTRQEDAEADLAAFLTERTALIVLDNFEHVLPAVGLVSGLLAAAPGVTVLVTSRAPLRVPREHVVTVPPLPVPTGDMPADVLPQVDAVALFIERARAVRPELEVSRKDAVTIGQLCVHLDGLPLAIELAAARVDLLSPRAILARLGRRLDLLGDEGEPAAEEPDPRHRSLRAAVAWSYDLLDETQQAVFRDLSVFAGGFTVDTAEAVVHAGPQLLQTIQALRRASLLRLDGSPGGEPRFRMLETVAAYGRERLERSGSQREVDAAHAAAFRALADQAEPELRGPDQVRWLNLLDAELPNIRQALHWASDGGDLDTGLDTAAQLWRFWQVRGLPDEARRQLEDLLTPPGGTSRARAAAQLSLARCAFERGDLPEVERWVTTCLAAHREAGDPYSEGFGLMILGAAIGRGGDAERGLDLLDEALEVARRSGDTWLEACALGYVGMVLSRCGRYDRARHALEEGLRGVRELGDSRLVGWFLVSLGRTALGAGDPTRARRRFDEALLWERRLGHARGEAWALQGLAAAAMQERDLDGAADLVLRSVRPARWAHSRGEIACAFRLLATVAAARGRPEIAAELLAAADIASPGTGDVWAVDADGLPSPEPATLRAALGDEAFEECWGRGRSMTPDEAFELGADLAGATSIGSAASHPHA